MDCNAYIKNRYIPQVISYEYTAYLQSPPRLALRYQDTATDSNKLSSFVCPECPTSSVAPGSSVFG